MTVALANFGPSFRTDRSSLVLLYFAWRQFLSICSTPTDRDTGRWKLDLSETQRRREVFWELYVYDSWQESLNLLGFELN